MSWGMWFTRSPRRIRRVIQLDTSQPERYPQWKTPTGDLLAVLSCDFTSRNAVALVPYEVTKNLRWPDPIDAIEWMSNSFGHGDNSRNRWVGHFSYDVGRLFERVPLTAADDVGFP